MRKALEPSDVVTRTMRTPATCFGWELYLLIDALDKAGTSVVREANGASKILGLPLDCYSSCLTLLRLSFASLSHLNYLRRFYP